MERKMLVTWVRYQGNTAGGSRGRLGKVTFASKGGRKVHSTYFVPSALMAQYMRAISLYQFLSNPVHSLDNVHNKDRPSPQLPALQIVTCQPVQPAVAG